MGRKTISIPEALERRIEDEAARRGRSFSATVVDLLEAQTRGGRRLRYVGVADDGEPDDAVRSEELLDELAARWRD